jgi:hypothetical protein
LAAGFTSEVPGEGLADRKGGGAGQADALPVGLDPATPLGTLLTMWQLGKPVERTAAGRALGVDPSRLIDLGLIGEFGGDLVKAEVVIALRDGLWFACDSTKIRGRAPIAENFVLPLTGSTLALAGCIPRDHFATALDMGTGCGIQAILASCHTERVVGTDVNRRALSMARFNAWLNGVTNVEFREGSLYEPAGSEQFDLLMANPPFVVSPETSLLYRDGGGGADEMCRDVVGQAGKVLRPGGLGVMMMNWVVHEGEQLFDGPRSWVEGGGTDALAIVNSTDDGETYARRWLGMNGVTPDPSEVARWTEHYRRLGISAIATGLIVVRLQYGDEGQPWFAHFAAPLIKSPKKADHLRHLIALQDFLHGPAGDVDDPEPLLSRVLRPAEGNQLYRAYTFRDGAYEPSEARARIGVGFPFSGGLDIGTADLLSRCASGQTLGDVLSGLAEDAGVDPEETVKRALPSVRHMLALGLLLPPEVPDLVPEEAQLSSDA